MSLFKICIFVYVLLFSGCSNFTSQDSKLTTDNSVKISSNRNKIESEIDFILARSIEVTNSSNNPMVMGAIDYDYTINPYFSHLAILQLMEISNNEIFISPSKYQNFNSTRQNAVRNWILWYLGELKEISTTPLVYSVYDYKVIKNSDGTFTQQRMDIYNNLNSTNLSLFDSIDSYNALFLAVLAEFLKQYPEDANLILTSGNKYKINLIESTLYNLFINNGFFTDVKLNTKTFYIMDNVEVYYSFEKYCELTSGNLKYENIHSDWICTFSAQLKSNIEQKMFSPAQQEYIVALQETDLSIQAPADKSKIYPYYIAQIYPFIFDLNTDSSRTNRSREIILNSTALNNWSNLVITDDPYLHFNLIYFLNKSGDFNNIDLFEKFYDFYINKNERRYYYHIAESASLIKLLKDYNLKLSQ